MFDEWLEVVAERTGTDPERDMYPRLVAAVVRAVGDAATETLRRGGPARSDHHPAALGFAEVAAGLPEPAKPKRRKK